jgi:hypothetical protein
MAEVYHSAECPCRADFITGFVAVLSGHTMRPSFAYRFAGFVSKL